MTTKSRVCRKNARNDLPALITTKWLKLSKSQKRNFSKTPSVFTVVFLAAIPEHLRFTCHVYTSARLLFDCLPNNRLSIFLQGRQRALVFTLQHRIPRFSTTRHHHTQSKRHKMPILRKSVYIARAFNRTFT